MDNIIPMNSKQKNTIKHNVFAEMVNANVIRQVEVISKEKKWWINIHAGNSQRVLVARRNNVRLFSSLDTVERSIKEVN
jgi:hypothetical protein